MLLRPFCLVAGQDLNQRPLSYEHYDARLPSLAPSLAFVMTWADAWIQSPTDATVSPVAPSLGLHGGLDTAARSLRSSSTGRTLTLIGRFISI